MRAMESVAAKVAVFIGNLISEKGIREERNSRNPDWGTFEV
jgi:hypothetical protein